MKRTLGTCYYPEHWPEDIWDEDARQMAELGLHGCGLGIPWSDWNQVRGNSISNGLIVHSIRCIDTG